MTRTAERATIGVTRRRWIAAGILVAAIIAGLGVHAWLPDGAVSDIAGDGLYAFAAYLAVVVIAPRLSPLAVGGIAVAWCVAVELFQLTGLPLEWGAVFPPVMLLLGTVFDPRDLLVYALALVAACAVDGIVTSLRRR